ncbi:hypothetical protein BF49_5611 [Bradyrhizobium sp.]|nr:hypothetical protein BF49_5611 [Bradyrhizobium sp.]
MHIPKPASPKLVAPRPPLPPPSTRFPKPAEPKPAAAPSPAPVLQTVDLDPIEYDEDGRRILTSPLPPPPRPQPTIIEPPSTPPTRYISPPPRRPVDTQITGRPRPKFVLPREAPKPQAFGPDDIPY